MGKTMAIFTLGCKVNRYDSEAIEETFIQAGYTVVSFEDKADVYIINTCTVTHMSDRKSRQMIRRAKKINPDSIVVVVGCYAQVAKEEIEAIEEVDLIIGTDKRLQILEAVEEFAKNQQPMNFVEDIMETYEFEELKINNMDKRTRAYLKIQEGCNNYCSYCIIPYARGNIRSRQADNIVDEVRRLASEGFKEIVLTGIHVASYGKDLKNTNLIEIIKLVHEVEGIERIRLSSIEPKVITDEFIEEIIKLPKFCKHFHLSLQSGSDTVLKRMKRRYTASEYKEAVGKLRKEFNDISFTTDIIVGFPGETEEEFIETVEFIKDIKFADIHIFPYSPREGTPAATMKDQISSQIKQERVKELSKVADGIKDKIAREYIGKSLSVLFEQSHKDDIYEGHTDNYMKVSCKSDEDISNQIKDVKITSVKNNTLCGIIE
ncbi:MAG: tRNA (N(6)-L-threonylcarbamoyladenosine(37)-C(2))-methylthiotransferase MtaB [Epulopiscium sp.]|nr:tRNA (N(6)-L-threonylcarbamoyladenosine(37)-C(2))-methylthiotransferase MtaB [Candidatus Epulonipiscium sp.]